jgi:pyruvate/2-oxoglutarate dehydrogenase complex dihydrolipoamide dehydrogenase (E3) component
MPDVDKYEILVLGSGEAGKYLAWTMAKEGRRTALVERRWLGGSCPNIACLPSKNLIYSAKVASLARRGPEFGVEMIRSESTWWAFSSVSARWSKGYIRYTLNVSRRAVQN